MKEFDESEPEPILFKLYEEMNMRTDRPKKENEPLNQCNSEEMSRNVVVKPEEDSTEEQKNGTSQENLTLSKNLDDVSRNLKVRLRYVPATSRLGDFKTEEWVHNWYQKRPESFRLRHAQSTVSIPPRNTFERRTGLRVGYKFTFPCHLPSDFQVSEEDKMS
ncbi:unnamed protein product [Hymenolepis diminuta]|uniref:Uncharacterized protein n=1 Tax=Hymenolepis diminuta TaxID=6216 RepID=A0A564YDI8_HYMDI|nr:unnamed protein product [Hymenolepis diminuta]